MFFLVHCQLLIIVLDFLIFHNFFQLDSILYNKLFLMYNFVDVNKMYKDENVFEQLNNDVHHNKLMLNLIHKIK